MLTEISPYGQKTRQTCKRLTPDGLSSAPFSHFSGPRMSQVARNAGLSRESRYKALSGERNPSFDTILKVIDALGLKLHAEPAMKG